MLQFCGKVRLRTESDVRIAMSSEETTMSAVKDKPAPDLSLIFPILNEESKIAGDIRSAAEYCHGLGKTTEIIIADDGREFHPDNALDLSEVKHIL